MLLDIVHVPGRSNIPRAHGAATAAIVVGTSSSTNVDVAALAAACGGGRGSCRAASCSCGRGSSWACRRPWTVGLQAAGTACSGGQALHMLSKHAARAHPGLGWPWGGCVGSQERVHDDSIAGDVYSILFSIADMKVFRVVHVIGDTVM